MMGNNSVELLSIALIREYLSRKGLKDVLEMFDRATKMKDYCINNRKLLAEELHVLDLVRKNKRDGKKLKTFIEMIVDEQINAQKQIGSEDSASKQKTVKRNPLGESNDSHLHNQNSKPTLLGNACQAPSPKETSIGKPNPSNDLKRRSPEEKNEKSSKVPSRESNLENGNKRNKFDSSNHYETIDDLDECDITVLNNSQLTSHTFSKARSIRFEEAVSLKELLFGTGLTSFNAEWRQQGFQYNEMLRYGLHQEKGGPCGLLASVQAYVLKHLFFIKKEGNYIPEISDSQQMCSLLHAFCDILHKVATNERYIVVQRSINAQNFPKTKYKPDKLTEHLLLHSFENFDQLKTFISNHLASFYGENGCILFLYSVILTAGIENVRSSFDNRDNTLMGRHGYCTQEMVNLLLTGKSTSNVHDGVINLDTGGTSQSVLQGISSRNEIGYLSLFEHYESCQVGDHYKNPLYPVWVIMCESHFSVAFSLDYPKERKKFNLFYYDGLARQDEDIKLTLTYDEPTLCEDIESPIELCIQTKWKDVQIHWNGTERLL